MMDDDGMPLLSELPIAPNPGQAWMECYHAWSPEQIGGRKGMVDRLSVCHDEYGEHPAPVVSRSDFLSWARSRFQLSEIELEQAANAWERSFYKLDRIQALG